MRPEQRKLLDQEYINLREVLNEYQGLRYMYKAQLEKRIFGKTAEDFEVKGPGNPLRNQRQYINLEGMEWLDFMIKKEELGADLAELLFYQLKSLQLRKLINKRLEYTLKDPLSKILDMEELTDYFKLKERLLKDKISKMASEFPEGIVSLDPIEINQSGLEWLQVHECTSAAIRYLIQQKNYYRMILWGLGIKELPLLPDTEIKIQPKKWQLNEKRVEKQKEGKRIQQDT